MARVLLTDKFIAKLRPGKPVMDDFARGLGVKRTPAMDDDTATFIYQGIFPDSPNPTRRFLGEYPTMTLADARDKAKRWRELLGKGIDPREDEQRIKTEAAKAAAVVNSTTIDLVIEAYIEDHIAGLRKAKSAAREIRKDILGPWTGRQVAEITRRDVVDLINSMRGTPYHARNTLSHIRTMFNWIIEQDKYGVEVSPCTAIKPKRLIGATPPRQRILSEIEIAALWRSTGKLTYPMSPFYRLLVLTGLRLNEVAGARWREFNPKLVTLIRKAGDDPIDWHKVPDDIKTWTIPRARFKSDAEHLVLLSNDACAVLAGLPRFTDGDFLFSTTFGKKPVNGFSKAKEILDHSMLASLKALARKQGEGSEVVLSPFVNHDIRRTVRTMLSSLRIPDAVAEMVIGHGRRGLQRVYDQHRFVQEQREAMEAWAAKLRAIVSPPKPTNVVRLKGARR